MFPKNRIDSNAKPVRVIFDIMWILLINVESWRRLSRNFSHVLAIEAKNIFGKNPMNQSPKAADMRRRSRSDFCQRVGTMFHHNHKLCDAQAQSNLNTAHDSKAETEVGSMPLASARERKTSPWIVNPFAYVH